MRVIEYTPDRTGRAGNGIPTACGAGFHPTALRHPRLSPSSEERARVMAALNRISAPELQEVVTDAMAWEALRTLDRRSP